MNYFAPFYEVEDKLDALLAEHGLVGAWQKMDYPLKLVITPNASPEAQISLLEQEEGTTSPDAKLCYTFDLDDVNVELDGRLAISESLMNKIKSLAKKMHYLWLQGFFGAEKEKHKGDSESPGDNGEKEHAEDDTSGEEEPTEGEGNDFDGFYSDEPEPDGQ